MEKESTMVLFSSDLFLELMNMKVNTMETFK